VVWDHNPITKEESEEDDEKIPIKIEEDQDYAQHKALFQTSPRHGSPVQRRIDYTVLLDTMYPALSRDRLAHRARSPIGDSGLCISRILTFFKVSTTYIIMT
jgi:hypothetical protein